jgi:hypothetical protein
MFHIVIPWDRCDVSAIPGNHDVKHRSSLGFQTSSKANAAAGSGPATAFMIPIATTDVS